MVDRTEFLTTLHPVDECPGKANSVVQRFMQTKGYGDAKPLGVFIDGQLLYYYYRLPEGVLEVELSPVEGRWQRRVSDFITSESDLVEMLGDCHFPAQPTHQPHDSAPPVVFRGASV